MRTFPRLGVLFLLALATGLLWPSAEPALAADVNSVDVGLLHTCALTTTGDVRCWGTNRYGQLGEGTTTDRTTPVDVLGLDDDVSDIAAGGQHTCALTTGGALKCWGWNRYGQLGNGATTGLAPNPAPVDVVGLESGVAALVAGGVHSCALTAAGGVKCWGWNQFGQLGNGQVCGFVCPAPVDVPGLTNGVTAIAAGTVHTCAVTTDAGVKCWGENGSGQLGDGTTTDSTIPVDVVALGANVAALSAGGSHTCVLTTAGGVQCWGDNGSGQLGDGRACGTACTIPVDVVELGTDVAALSAGENHTCVLTTDGSVQCWGDNGSGQLGDGQACGVTCTVPVEVSGLGSGVAAIAAGGDQTCAMTGAGDIKCWGANGSGQLGDGTTVNGATPVNVVGLKPVSGDVDCSGAANIRDAQLIAQLVVGRITQLSCPDAADVTGDDAVSIVDAQLIAQFVVGRINSLPPS